jgi:hypothetical protein
MDLQDREHNTKDGLHIASLAGAWQALVGGFGGMRADQDGLSFMPQLPPGLAGLSFRMRYQGRVLLVKVRHGAATYSLIEGDPLPIIHHGERLTVGTDAVTMLWAGLAITVADVLSRWPWRTTRRSRPPRPPPLSSTESWRSPRSRVCNQLQDVVRRRPRPVALLRRPRVPACSGDAEDPVLRHARGPCRLLDDGHRAAAAV